MPKARTERWAIWRACERLGILPPSVRASWDECDLWIRASIIGFDQVRQSEADRESL